MTLESVLEDIADERARQDEKFPDQHLPNLPSWARYPSRIFTGVTAFEAKSRCDEAAQAGHLSWAHVLREEVAEALEETRDPAALRAELIQVAAVAARWVEDLDSRESMSEGEVMGAWWRSRLAAQRGAMRTFDSGATRDSDEGKLDYEAYLSPRVLRRYAEYMAKCAVGSDGARRPGDNWQRGWSTDVSMKSLLRHVMTAWEAHRESGVEDEEAICAIIFNAFALLFEVTK